ncbi:WW domain binding protein 2 isoform X2 [Rhynchophorus ferrugineus]|uniref:WW domain binding protein 2 isoform X2 n=1 Tax=Rhynchophorus ferrugineus TaxID=354439 RepID=UPI003FCD55FA
MSLNTAHINGGVLIHSGEQILLFSDNVNVEWSGQEASAFRSKKNGRIFLTTHRVIFNNNSLSDEMQSFSFPFVTLSEVEVEQPVFGANYVKGKVRAQPNGNWVGEAKFKMTFKHGGAIDFGQALLRAAHYATRGAMNAPPPYEPPQPQWYAAPPPAYAPPPQGYYGWVPPTNVFPQQPPTDGVFMTDAPPPYPGIYPAGQPNGYGPPGYGGPGGYPQQGASGFPSGGPSGYPPQAGGYPPQAGGYPPQAGGYPPQAGAFANSADAKAAEAAQSAYYDPNRPQMAYVPPPAYYENPPTYNQATNPNKKEQ